MNLSDEILTGFKKACKVLLVEGCNRARRAGSIGPDTDEEDVTKELVTGMHQFNEGSFEYPIYIDWEAQEKSMYNLETISDASSAKRVDLILSRVRSGTTDYAVECKRLKAADRGLHRDYWNKGAMRFVKAEYADRQSFGAMAGYVLEGSISTNKEYVQAKCQDYESKLRLAMDWNHQESLSEIEIYQTAHRRPLATVITLDHYLMNFT
jgi:hypothetical protein